MTDSKIIETINDSISAAIDKYSELQESNFNNIKLQLSHVIEGLHNLDVKVTKQNGNVADTIRRVATLESSHHARALDCPYKACIDNLMQDSIRSKERTMTVADFKSKIGRYILLGCSILGVLFPLVYFLLNFFFKR